MSKKSEAVKRWRKNTKQRIIDSMGGKCVLVCSNCHKEIHDGVTTLTDSYETFDETYGIYKEVKSAYDTEPCPICGGRKLYNHRTCSLSCAAKKAYKVDWDSIDLKQLLKEHSYVYIGELLGVSDVAVRKRAKKLSLI